METPERFAKMYQEIFCSLHEKPPDMKTFTTEDKDMVTVMHMPFYSTCEHHFVPFHGTCHIAYIPDGKLSGLSKFGRVLRHFAAKPNIQEDLTKQIADYIFEQLNPVGLLVYMEAEHLCMSMRGIKLPGHKTITVALRGSIDKQEVFEHIKMGRGNK